MEPLGRISYVCDGDCQLQSTEPAPGVVVTSEASPQSTGRRRGRSKYVQLPKLATFVRFLPFLANFSIHIRVTLVQILPFLAII